MSNKKEENRSLRLRWPIDDVLAYAKRYAFTHSLLCLMPNAVDQATIVPFSLFPSRLSSSHFNFIWSIQTAYNDLYLRVSLDDKLLERALSSVIPIDDFVARLWKIHRTAQRRQPIQLDIYRNDYMLDTKVNKMRQVEFNTISSAFAGLTNIVGQLQKAVLNYAVDNCIIREVTYTDKPSSDQQLTIDLIQPNEALKKSAEAMVKAYELYQNNKACILFVIVPNERNICDQNALIDAVLALRSSIRFHMKTIDQLIDELELDSKTYNLYLKPTHDEIGLVYFRAGYIPDHYTSEASWLVREHIEQSRAIKCPTVRSQLAGCKIVQEYLTRPGIVEMLVDDGNKAADIRSTFAAMFAFDDKQTRQSNIDLLRANPDGYVVKPQREGGGNNKYGDDILTLLDDKDKNLLNNYIGMEKIVPPICYSCLVKPYGQHVMNAECINEIGIFGTMVSNVDTHEIFVNEVAGYLVRTKTVGTNEGGVATGYSVLDCLDVSERENGLAKLFAV